MITDNIDTQIEYLDSSKFVKFTNTEDFPDLSADTAAFLKNHGIYCDEWGLPGIITNGILKPFKPNLIEFGVSRTDARYCIDIQTQNVVMYFIDNDEVDILNSSVRTLVKIQYAVVYYYKEIEFKKIYGGFYENKNHKKYARVFREILNEAEPGIENFVPWEEEIFQKELGVT